MSLRRATRLVARREFGERIHQRAFQISTVVTLLIVAGIALAAGLLGDDGPQDFEVGAHGAEAVAIAEAAGASGKAFDVRIAVKRFTSAADARAAAKDERVDAAIVNRAIVSKDGPPSELEQALQAAARQVRAARTLRREGLSAPDARRALAPSPLEMRALDGGDDDARRGVAFVASLLLYLQLIVYGLAVATGVVEEKSSRVVEILLAAVPSRALLAGKIAGIGLLGLLQLALVTVVGLAVASASGAVELGSGDAGVLAVVLVWFLLGYLLWATIYAISGVIVSRQEDLQSSSTPGHDGARRVLPDRIPDARGSRLQAGRDRLARPVLLADRDARARGGGRGERHRDRRLARAAGAGDRAARAARRAHLRRRGAARGQAAEDARGLAGRASREVGPAGP